MIFTREHHITESITYTHARSHQSSTKTLQQKFSRATLNKEKKATSKHVYGKEIIFLTTIQWNQWVIHQHTKALRSHNSSCHTWKNYYDKKTSMQGLLMLVILLVIKYTHKATHAYL